MVGPNATKVMTVMKKSTTSKALPIWHLKYFFTTIAMMSVPPVEEPMLKSIAEPHAGRKTPNNSSMNGWSVSGWVSGVTVSNSLSITENAIVT